MKISYAVTVCNEFIEIQRLLNFLLEHKRPQDEIVVQMDLTVDDMKNHPEDKSQVHVYLMKHNTQGNIRVVFCPLNNDFGAFKNHLTKECTGDYIFQIDADEVPNENLIKILHLMLEDNLECETFQVPRVNTVEGLTQEHIQKWGWDVNEHKWVNWPDYQWRIWKNKPEIKWVNKVHERLDGFKAWTQLPAIEEFSLYHPKTIDKQEKQNSYYDTI
jgi:glycosyltransferase involved in cell wall biosynthesis